MFVRSSDMVHLSHIDVGFTVNNFTKRTLAFRGTKPAVHMKVNTKRTTVRATAQPYDWRSISSSTSSTPHPCHAAGLSPYPTPSPPPSRPSTAGETPRCGRCRLPPPLLPRRRRESYPPPCELSWRRSWFATGVRAGVKTMVHLEALGRGSEVKKKG